MQIGIENVQIRTIEYLKKKLISISLVFKIIVIQFLSTYRFMHILYMFVCIAYIINLKNKIEI